MSGAAIYLFAASTTGYGTPSISLLTAGSPGVSLDGLGRGYVTTDGGGSFTISGSYTCTSASALVYMVALGGNPGLPSGTNPALAEVVALGPCGGLTSKFISINELTTVAAMAALAPFTDPLTMSVSTSTTNVLGLTNAFVTAQNLVDTSNGGANLKTPGGIGTIPYREINTLGDILAACVNSDGGSGSPCKALFTATTIDGVAPTNTMQAMLNITRRPAQNVAALYALATSTAPFQPTLPAVYNDFSQTYDGSPNDWSIAITHADTSILAPNAVTIDSKGNVWAASGQNQTAVQISPAGVLNYVVSAKDTQSQISANNYNLVLAVDLGDNLWVDNNSYGVTKISSTGVRLSGNSNWGFTPGPGTNSAALAFTHYPGDYWIAGYGGIAVDPSNNLWIGSADYDHSAVVHTDNNAVGLNFYDGSSGGLRNPSSVTVDPFGNVWLVSYNGSYGTTMVKFSSTGTILSGPTGFPAGNAPLAAASDHLGNIWIADYGSQMVTALDNLGVPLVGSPYSGGGLAFPSAIVVDGGGNSWLSSFNSPGVAEFSGANGAALSNARGFFSGTFDARQTSVAVDASGNVWVAAWGGNSVNEIVGIASPTATPLALALKNNTVGIKP